MGHVPVTQSPATTSGFAKQSWLLRSATRQIDNLRISLLGNLTWRPPPPSLPFALLQLGGDAVLTIHQGNRCMSWRSFIRPSAVRDGGPGRREERERERKLASTQISCARHTACHRPLRSLQSSHLLHYLQYIKSDRELRYLPTYGGQCNPCTHTHPYVAATPLYIPTYIRTEPLTSTAPGPSKISFSPPPLLLPSFFLCLTLRKLLPIATDLGGVALTHTQKRKGKRTSEREELTTL
ncbi:hypothetical protein GGS23DRAFT_409504 [Durotheca rogersii]|uniref:uncharacterized protein n=1 Tax=Durotheca rogersii TaxID=419775 RepID=UPI00221E5633|nr:uncharacterized protein GGS23DRAFT_409504 [Durotheca rogersii]KAI5865105.1 hypothetical protein GGS23DRAFT_409504 [Durotheca rogersii]